MSAQTLGARLAAASPDKRFALHVAEGDRGSFADYDRVLAGLLDRAIRGEQVVDVTPARRRTDSDVVTITVGDHEREILEAMLAPTAQQARGGWYVPEADRQRIGMIEFARWAKAEPRFSISAADAQRAAVQLDAMDAIVIWAALEPVMELLYLPFKLRSGYWLGDRRPDLMQKDWASVDGSYAALGIDSSPLAAFKDGRAWATRSIEDVMTARDALLEAWKGAPGDVGERAILLLISRLVERYYAKAKEGMAQRTKVMNKGLERALTGAFGGDWLSFVRYLGEQVHPGEQIATAVEPTSMLVSGRDRAAQAAAATGVAVEEIERMLTAYWGGQHDSPVEQRARVMREWWTAFDTLHARQAPAMPSLWGLLGDRFEDMGQNSDDGRYTRRGYELLPPELNRSVEDHWGTAVLPRWPHALVTEAYPHATFAEALGPGIDFWHGVALTCWFICEGPYSRTEIGGIPNYYDRQIKLLEAIGCPIDFGMFADLRAAEKRLTDRPPPAGETTEHNLGEGMSFSITISTGSDKKDGFEHMRDVVTRYRRAWAEQHLERYLHARWEQDLRAVGDDYHRHVADKGKPPTVKQFAKIAEHTANHWFGGDLAQLCNALGLPSPEPQQHRRMLPTDRGAFVTRVRELLGGQRWETSPEDIEPDERERRLRLSELADRAPAVVQIWEATGDPPPLIGASWARSRLETAFGPDTEAGWQKYLGIVDQVVHEPQATPQAAIPSAPAVVETAPLPRPPIATPSAEAAVSQATKRGVRGLLSRLRG